MTHHPFKPVLLDLLRQAQTSQNAFFEHLPADDLVTSGTPDLWSAKDHVAHMTFWRQRLVLKVLAIIRQEPHPEDLDFEQQNPLLFEEQRHRPWSAILSESDQAYADLIACTEQLTEEDLTAWGRFDWMRNGEPLYIAYMGNCYDHTQAHLAQYLLDRNDLEHALEIYEVWARRVLEAHVPDTLKGYMLYNLACFYATHTQVEKARPALQQAFVLNPALREFAVTDPDLVPLQSNSSE